MTSSCLLRYTKEVLSAVDTNISVDDLSTSWNDGMAFCAVVSCLSDSLIDCSNLSPENRAENVTLAFTKLEEFLTHPPTAVSAADVLAGDEVSEDLVVKFLHSLGKELSPTLDEFEKTLCETAEQTSSSDSTTSTPSPCPCADTSNSKHEQCMTITTQVADDTPVAEPPVTPSNTRRLGSSTSSDPMEESRSAGQTNGSIPSPLHSDTETSDGQSPATLQPVSQQRSATLDSLEQMDLSELSDSSDHHSLTSGALPKQQPLTGSESVGLPVEAAPQSGDPVKAQALSSSTCSVKKASVKRSRAPKPPSTTASPLVKPRIPQPQLESLENTSPNVTGGRSAQVSTASTLASNPNIPDGTIRPQFNQADGGCNMCGLEVFDMERLEVEEVVIHRRCLRCHVCKAILQMQTYEVFSNRFTCQHHYRMMKLQISQPEGVMKKIESDPDLDSVSITADVQELKDEMNIRSTAKRKRVAPRPPAGGAPASTPQAVSRETSQAHMPASRTSSSPGKFKKTRAPQPPSATGATSSPALYINRRHSTAPSITSTMSSGPSRTQSVSSVTGKKRKARAPAPPSVVQRHRQFIIDDVQLDMPTLDRKLATLDREQRILEEVAAGVQQEMAKAESDTATHSIHMDKMRILQGKKEALAADEAFYSYQRMDLGLVNQRTILEGHMQRLVLKPEEERTRDDELLEAALVTEIIAIVDERNRLLESLEPSEEASASEMAETDAVNKPCSKANKKEEKEREKRLKKEQKEKAKKEEKERKRLSRGKPSK